MALQSARLLQETLRNIPLSGRIGPGRVGKKYNKTKHALVAATKLTNIVLLQLRNLSTKYPQLGLATRNINGKTPFITPITEGDTPSCFPYTVRNGKIGPIAAKQIEKKYYF